MGRYSVKRYKTKRRTRDLDLVYEDLSSKESIQRLKNQPLDETKPGLGQYYCIECAKYFENQPALDRHWKGKIHKRRVKLLKVKPYSNLEAEAATGLNMQKFVESVEKYKQLEQEKAAHKDEIDLMLYERKDTLDAIITGVPSDQAAEAPVEAPADETTMTE